MNRLYLVPVALSLLFTWGIAAAPSASAEPPVPAHGPWADGVAGAPRPDVAPDRPRTFGTSAAVAHTIGATAFTPSDSTTETYASVLASGMRHCLGGGCILLAPAYLPAGALVTAFEIDVCDTNGAADAIVTFNSSPAAQDAGTSLAQAKTSGTPGCVLVNVALPMPETIDNRNKGYFFTYFAATSDATVSLHAVRVFYQLQVTPAPATATFGDVSPSHPFFQFVEALVASGITAGCGGGNYCPDAPLTRGQMAVFLSKALGLHFAP